MFLVPFVSACTKITTLLTPNILEVYQSTDELYIEFEEVDNANSYEIVINGLSFTAISSPFLATDYLSDEIMFEITIKAKTIKENFVNSSYSTIFYYNNKPTLSAPVLNLDFNDLSWQAISGATLYTVSVNDITFITNKTEFDIMEDEEFAQILQIEVYLYTIKVKANSNAEYNASDYSVEVVYDTLID